MPAGRHYSRMDTMELKIQIERKIGQQKTEKYFSLLSRYLSFKLSKSEFDKHCVSTIGRENISLHNCLIRSILKNASLAKTAPVRETKTGNSLNVKITNGYQRSSLQSLCRDVFPQSPRKGRTPNLRDRKFRDRLSPLGPHGKIHSVPCEDSVPKVHEQQSATELLSLGSRQLGEGNSVEDGEEVEQIPGIYSRSPVKEPLGLPVYTKGTRKLFSTSSSSSSVETCHGAGALLDTRSIKSRLEHIMEQEGLKISMDCTNLLGNSLDIYLKTLIKPCLEIAGSRSGRSHQKQVSSQPVPVVNGKWPVKNLQKPMGSVSASMLDFRVAMELNPSILGKDWPVQLEKVCLRASEE
ncbi:Transcriptional coactivator Hfi1/Transcriptional adapter 1 [Dillenia turbinata]|uniref:Transcriptional coactivator Hfi1/Transcriptional adapter 1 n=1 Tax=Dillenia turbinata TaxID=194707 RepID=A0AAN8Z1N2_9MAGN